MERMDYLDRFFEPKVQTASVAAAEPQWNAAAPWGAESVAQPAPVVAMEPIPNPAPSSATDPTPHRASARAAEPRPNPSASSPPQTDMASRARTLVRQNRWLTQFWMELTPEQQTRVQRQLRRGNVQLAAERAEPAAIWDPMGLTDRVNLIFGGAPPGERPAPPERRDSPMLARDS